MKNQDPCEGCIYAHVNGFYVDCTKGTECEYQTEVEE